MAAAPALLPPPQLHQSLKSIWWLTALGLSVSILIRRSPTTWPCLRHLSLQQILTFLELGTTAAFIYAAAILEIGVTSTHNDTSCSVGILLCFLAYGISKLLLFGFYTERIYLVWSTYEESQAAPPLPRARSKWYRTSAVLLGLYWCGGMTTIISRFAYRSEDENKCFIGLRPYGSITVVVMQGLVNIYFLIALLIPLWSSWLECEKGRKMARSTAAAVVVAFLVTTANITGLVVQGGRGYESWLCMLTCGLDLLINSIAVFLITSAPNYTRPTAARRASFVSQFGTALPPAPIVPPQNFGVGFANDDRDSFVSQEHPVGRRASEILSPLTAFSFQWPRRGSKDDDSVASRDWEEKV